ncbi:MAG: FHA domain-containing protein, partial [Planctomycetaceae bacterium]|nr:FHA domain-containing protein [Planctomycetaceae bacterium]
MSLLLVKSHHGEIRQFELSKNQPLTIGAHSISDVQLDSEGIALIEARISWLKKQYEITAAGTNNLIINGDQVKAAPLNSGDRITIGTVELLFTTPEDLDALGDDPFSESHNSQVSEEIGLQPISEEISTWEKQSQPSVPPHTSKPDSLSDKAVSKSVPQKTELEDIDNQAFFEQALEEEPEDQETVAKTTLSRSRSSDSSSASQAVKPTSGGLRESLYASRQRPGEKEIFRSPLIMGLALLGVFLLIGSVILWSLIDLEEADRYLAQARAQAEQRKFQKAIENYEQFLIKFPS